VVSVTPSSRRLTAGILMPAATTHPRQAPDSLSSMVAAQMFEPPYRAPVGEGPAEPVLFEGLKPPTPGAGDGRAAPR
jgi:hypothetical protein